MAVLEVGLGGRLDSTNVCEPAVSVITSISYDHTQQLGSTLAAIAREKAGPRQVEEPKFTKVVRHRGCRRGQTALAVAVLHAHGRYPDIAHRIAERIHDSAGDDAGTELSRGAR